MSWRISSPETLVEKWSMQDHCDGLVRNYNGTPTSLTYEENMFGNSAGSFDGADTVVTVSNNSNLQGLFDGGGTIAAWVRADSDGESNAGKVAYKDDEYFIDIRNEVGGEMQVEFYQYFSTTDGTWITTATEVAVEKSTFLAVTYDSSDVANDPVIYVGKRGPDDIALTEVTTPAGTAETDTTDFLMGNNEVQSRTFDGLIWDVYTYSVQLTWDEILKLERLGRT